MQGLNFYDFIPILIFLLVVSSLVYFKTTSSEPPFHAMLTKVLVFLWLVLLAVLLSEVNSVKAAPSPLLGKVVGVENGVR